MTVSVDKNPDRPLIEFNLDPEIEAFIEISLQVSNHLSTDTRIEQQRLNYDAACRHFFHGFPDKIEATDAKIDGRHGDIAIRRYCYDDNNPASSTQIVFIHGGGFILGSLDSHDYLRARHISRKAANSFRSIIAAIEQLAG